jgi:protein-S-isoprenylcysteine O-methyltransferase Ste14
MEREQPPYWAQLFSTIQRKSVWDFPGRKVITVGWAVNIHKIITAFIVLGMMAHYDNFSVGAWVYLALHGTYGYCWLIKDFGFADQRFRSWLSLGGAINLYLTLIGWYWLIPWLFISRYVEPTGAELSFGVALHTLGVVLTVASDCQRHFTLKYKSGLMTGGLFRYTRNPNYLGEIMLYSAYAYLADHWLAWAVVGFAAITAFLPNMYAKDASISRHDGWKEYKAQSSLLIPWALINGRGLSDALARGRESYRALNSR